MSATSDLLTLVEKSGHDLEGWRCLNCLRTFAQITKPYLPLTCTSPNPEGKFLFINGPFHGEWVFVPPGRTDWTMLIYGRFQATFLESDAIEPSFFDQITYLREILRTRAGALVVFRRRDPWK